VKNSNTNTKDNKGTVLVLVISIMGFMGVVMLFLSSASNTMNFQTNKVYLEACERNLTSSGLSWAKANIKNETITDFNDTIPLDVNDMNILRSSLELKINQNNEQNEVQIKTSCGQARLNRSTQKSFIINGS
jgi:hypothetical protein